MQPPIWAGRATPRDLTDTDFATAAALLGCEIAALRAVWEVEASGRCFDAAGGVLRRFEPHLMPAALWPRIGFDPAGQAAWRASLALAEPARDRMFAAACRADLEAALRATSWGGPQILGRWFAELGYPSAQAMVRDFATGAPPHLAAFVRLVQSWRIDAALRARDWLAFATRYNGTGQPQVYAARIEAAFRRHSGVASAVVLRLGDRGPAVAVLQRALRVPDDGAFGPGTLEAVMGFQTAHGLTPDGIVGRATWDALGIAPEAAAAIPAQPTPGETRLDQLGRVGAVLAPVAGAAPLVPVLQGAVPPLLWQAAWWIAGGLALLALAPWIVRRLRRVWR